MRRTAGITIALVALGASAEVARAQAPARPKAERAANSDDLATKVRTILLAIREDEPLSSEILTKRLVGLGSVTTPMLLEALESGLVPAASGPTSSKEPETMDDARTAAAISALSKRSRGELVQPATRLLERSTSTRFSATAMRLLGAVGDRRELAVLCGAVRPTSSEIVDGELTDAFEAAVTEILKRDTSASATTHGLLREQPESTRWSLIRAVANAPSESTLPVLASELRVHPEDDAFLLEQMTQSCASLPSPISESILMPVRSCLTSDEPARVAKAARCLAAMQDTESVDEFIVLLRHADPEVVREVHAALVSITNVGLLPDADRWNRWLAGETAWFRDEFPELSGKLQGASAVIAVQAISQMAAHPMYRREISEALTSALEHDPASIRKLACSALRQLGAKTAVPVLERWAEDTDPDLAVEARRALSVLGPPGSGGRTSATTADDAQGTAGSGR